MKKVILLSLVFSLFYIVSSAQESVDSLAGSLDKLDAKVADLSKKIEVSSRLKISGYVQVQWQMASGKGMPAEMGGGDFPINSDNRFQIRRGRIKFDYTYGIAKAVLQIDATEKGVKLKDANVSLLSKSKVIGMTAGVMDRPFGYEISYSSSVRETPERSRVYQLLFPDERDLGAKVSLQGKKNTFLESFKFDGGLYCGNGANVETNSAKDFIGHLTFKRDYKNISFGLGASLYAGRVLSEKDVSYSFNSATMSYTENSNALNKYYKRMYWGGDAQFSAKTLAGKTTLRAEVLGGKQPGTLKSSNSPKAAIASEIYNRDFFGYSLYAVQDICKSKFSAVARLDYYDPNTEISASAIGREGSGTSSADVAFTTFGYGGLYRISEIFRIMAYYEHVWNEKCPNLTSADPYKDFSKNIKDNLFTLRLQVKF